MKGILRCLPCRKREMQSKGPSGRDSQGRGRYQQGRGQSSGRGRGHQQGRVGGHYVRTQPGFGSQHMRQETGGGRDQGYFPNEGFRPPGQFVGMGTIMPNFGRPFGVIPPPGMHPLVSLCHLLSKQLNKSHAHYSFQEGAYSNQPSLQQLRLGSSKSQLPISGTASPHSVVDL